MKEKKELQTRDLCFVWRGAFPNVGVLLIFMLSGTFFIFFVYYTLPYRHGGSEWKKTIAIFTHLIFDDILYCAVINNMLVRSYDAKKDLLKIWSSRYIL